MNCPLCTDMMCNCEQCESRGMCNSCIELYQEIFQIHPWSVIMTAIQKGILGVPGPGPAGKTTKSPYTNGHER